MSDADPEILLDPAPAHGRYTLRPVTDADEAWMWPAGCEMLRPYVEPIYGWREKDARYFFDREWKARQAVQVAGENAGWLELARRDDFLFLHEIGLLPAFQKQGLGTQILEDIIAHAEANGWSVELQVLVTNPARRLYERCGFRQTHAKMSRPPGGWKCDPPTLQA